MEGDPAERYFPLLSKFKGEFMKIKMKQDKLATANEAGSSTMVYKKDSVMDMSAEWQMKLASKWLNNGVAEQAKSVTQKKVITEVQKKKKSIKKK